MRLQLLFYSCGLIVFENNFYFKKLFRNVYTFFIVLF